MGLNSPFFSGKKQSKGSVLCFCRQMFEYVHQSYWWDVNTFSLCYFRHNIRSHRLK